MKTIETFIHKYISWNWALLFWLPSHLFSQLELHVCL